MRQPSQSQSCEPPVTHTGDVAPAPVHALRHPFSFCEINHAELDAEKGNDYDIPCGTPRGSKSNSPTRSALPRLSVEPLLSIPGLATPIGAKNRPKNRCKNISDRSNTTTARGKVTHSRKTGPVLGDARHMPPQKKRKALPRPSTPLVSDAVDGNSAKTTMTALKTWLNRCSSTVPATLTTAAPLVDLSVRT